MSSTVDAVAPTPRTPRYLLLGARFRRRPLAVASLIVLLVLVAAAAFAPYIAPQSPSATDFDAILAHPSRHHLLGTDGLGRDVFSRLVWGARISITVALLATLLALTIAVPLGLVAGFYRGWLDAVVARVTDVMLAFPYLILAIGLAAILGASPTTATLALGIAAVPGLVRIARAEALVLREADFVPAAVASGAGEWTILFRHLLPNMAPTLIVQATVLLPRMIIGEAAMAFLGLSVRPPGASWGGMLQDAQQYVVNGQAPRLAVYPGLVIVLAVLAFNMLGDGLRDVLDPKAPR